MIKSFKKNKTSYLKNRIMNTLMKDGKKTTGEKILLKSLKSLQRSTAKNCKILLQLSITNLTSTFKINEQSVRKGKRKTIKNYSSFITNDSLRIIEALKLLVNSSSKSKNLGFFYKRLTTEILSSSALKGQSIEQKNTIQKQVLTNRRYLSKFRW